MIRLLALDLDQTLFGNDLAFSPRVKAAVAEAQKAGLVVTIATGREAAVAARFARDLGLTAPIICTQGACIYDHVHDRILRNETLSPTLLPRLINAATRHNWNFHFEMANRLFLPAHSNHPPAFFELLRYSKWSRVDNLLDALKDGPHKMVVTVEHVEDRPQLIAEMTRALGPDVTIVPSHPFLVEALPPHVNKGHALEWLAKSLNIPQAEVMAIGDSDADISMIEWAGLGVAMGNASSNVKAAADWTAPTLAEDGAAVAIERFALPMDDTRFLRQFQAAEGWLGLGDCASATEELESLPPRLQQNPAVLRLRWDIFTTAKKWDAALEVATIWTQVDPGEKHAWLSRSFALHELKRTAEARENLLMVLDKFPGYALMRYNLACYECQLGNLDAACDLLRKAFALPGGREFRSTGMIDPDLAPIRARISEL